MTVAKLSLRIDLPGGRLGPGKIDLLEAVAREGSISAAARSIGMSYRRAWELVEEVRNIFGGAVVATSAGGRKGGGASLTPLGEEIVRRFRASEQLAGQAVEREIDALVRSCGTSSDA